LQIRKFPYAMRTTAGRMFRKKDASDGSMTPFQAVCTALAGTVGTGNIAGVASAIYFGGPGSIFWMWIITLIGAASAYTESALGQAYKNLRLNYRLYRQR
jgi:AGCS family alanine or glycine:cation symporter